ncbi:MAG: hypothetical protein GX537_10310 [Actinobacteria bacterium]|nr:hypothetical protein [Actinomycetota bacterium]
MDGLATALLIFVTLGVLAFIGWEWHQHREFMEMNPEEREKELNQQAVARAVRERAAHETAFGAVNVTLICPHCQQKGLVRTKPTTQKKGVSGTKATAAVLTGGLSMVATGLSRKEHLTQAHCDKCGSTWCF